jgi:hypothetical protein
MPSNEYYEGRDMEKNKNLHDKLIEIFKFDLIDTDGSSGTKVDIFATKNNIKTCFSVKNVTGKNTQVHLTTLKKMSVDLKIKTNLLDLFNRWLGTNDQKMFKTWSKGLKLSNYELSHNRINSSNIIEWQKIEEWVNKINKNELLPNLLIKGNSTKERPNYLIWVNKKQKYVKIICVEKLIKFISTECKWITMPKGTTLRCVNKENKPVMWLQMKGNRTEDGYNHHPQFHIVENWPRDLIEYEFYCE